MPVTSSPGWLPNSPPSTVGSDSQESPRFSAPPDEEDSNDKPKARIPRGGSYPTIYFSGPVNLRISNCESTRKGKKRKIEEAMPEDVDGVLEKITGKFDGLMRNLPNTYERVPNAATMMNCSLPQIQHQGIYPEEEWLLQPINTYQEAPFPNSIDRVKYIYKDRLAAREQVDWECRRLNLRLTKLRELKALEEQYNLFTHSNSSPNPEFSEMEKPDWYKANNDEDLVQKIRIMEQNIELFLENDSLQSSSVASSSKSCS